MGEDFGVSIDSIIGDTGWSDSLVIPSARDLAAVVMCDLELAKGLAKGLLTQLSTVRSCANVHLPP